jgi:hypothetical protein
VPAGPDRAGRESERVVAADAVEDEGGAPAAGDAPQVARGQSGCVEDRIGAAVGREVERLVAPVHGDDPRRADRLQQLDGDVTEAADADHDRARAGAEEIESAADGVVRRQRCVGQRRSGHRVQAVERNGQAGGGHDHVLRQAAVAAKPGAAPLPLSFAQMLGPDAACGAAATAPRPVHEHRFAGLDAVGSRAERGDGARDLVTEREGQRVRKRTGLPVHEMQVGVAETRAADAHEHLARPGFRRRDVDQLGGALPSGEADRLHKRRR